MPVKRDSCAMFIIVFLSFGLNSASGTTCETIRIPMCSSMPYNVTQIPNLLHHSNQLNALLILEQYQPLVATNCSQVLLFFLCSIFTPVCPVNFSQDVIPPCQDVCLRARSGCEPVLAGYNLTWPQDLSCEELPPYETGVCISPEAINSSPSKKARMLLKRKAKNLEDSRTKKNGTIKKDCTPSNLLDLMVQAGKIHQFAIRATLTKVLRTKSQFTFTVQLIEIFHTSSLQLSINQTVTISSSLRSMNKATQCGLGSPDDLRLGRDYLMMGQKRAKGQSTTLTCYSNCVIQPWKKTLNKVVQRWKRLQKGRTTPFPNEPVTSTKAPKRESTGKRKKLNQGRG